MLSNFVKNFLNFGNKKVCDFFETTDDLLNINEFQSENFTAKGFKSSMYLFFAEKDLRNSISDFRKDICPQKALLSHLRA